MHLIFFYLRPRIKIFLYSDISVFRYLDSSACPSFSNIDQIPEHEAASLISHLIITKTVNVTGVLTDACNPSTREYNCRRTETQRPASLGYGVTLSLNTAIRAGGKRETDKSCVLHQTLKGPCESTFSTKG